MDPVDRLLADVDQVFVHFKEGDMVGRARALTKLQHLDSRFRTVVTDGDCRRLWLELLACCEAQVARGDAQAMDEAQHCLDALRAGISARAVSRPAPPV